MKIDSQMDYGDQDGMGYHGEDGHMYADGDMMGSDDDGMGHGMGDSYGHEGSPGYPDVNSFLVDYDYFCRAIKRMWILMTIQLLRTCLP